MIPTLFGITIISFILINLAPGSPVEQKLQQMRFGGAMGGANNMSGGHNNTGVSQEVIDALNKQYGFDKPLLTRYWIWLGNLSRLDFGDSFRFEEPVTKVIAQRFPVSITFGIVSFILTYLVCIPLGVLKAIRNGSAFDRATSFLLSAAYSIPPIILGILLLVYFAGASHFNLFPMGGLRSDDFDSMPMWRQWLDLAHHFVLPLFCYMIGSFTFLTFLMKNSLLDVIKLDYVRTARAKGLNERKTYLKHALRNALIPIITGMSDILSVFFAGSILIEKIFNLDGMGLLSLTAVGARDYNVLMGLIFIEAVLALLGRLFSDMLYVVVDPRIDFQ